MKIQSFLLLSLRFILFPLLLVVSAQAQQPRFKVAAFYSTTGEMDHINFARDALYFLNLISEQQQFTFDATRDWTNLNDDYLANYNLIIWLNDFPHSDSTWPWSQDVIAEQAAHLSPELRKRILRDNVAELYKLAA